MSDPDCPTGTEEDGTLPRRPLRLSRATYDPRMSPWKNLSFTVLRPLVCVVRGHRDDWWDVVSDADHSEVLHQFTCCTRCARILTRPAVTSGDTGVDDDTRS